MARRRGPVAAPEQCEAVAEGAPYVLRRHGPDPGRRQLDGERKTVEPFHDVGHDVGLEVRFRSGGPRPAYEELAPVGDRELAEVEHPLRGDAERRAARGDDAEVAGGHEQVGHQRGHRVEQVLAVVEDEQGRDGVELLGDPTAHVGELRRRESTTAGHRVADPQSGPDLGDHVLPGRDADQLDEVHAGLGRLPREDVGDAGLAQPTGSEDRREAAGADQGPQPGQVGLPAQQLVDVVAHAAADRLVGGEELAVDPLQGRVRIDAEPLGQVTPVGVVAGERRRHTGRGGLAPEESLQRLGVVRLRRVHPTQHVEGLGVLAGPAQGESPHPPHHRGVTVGDPAELGQRSFSGRVSGAVQQAGSRLGQHERLRSPAVGERTAGVRHQALEDPGVDRVVGEGEPVPTVGARDRLGPQLRPEPRDEHLQRLARDGRRVVAPHLVDQAQVGHARGMQGQGGQQVGRTASGDRGAVVRHLVEEPQQDRHRASIGIAPDG